MEMFRKKKKVVVVMGASGAGKSRLAIDMASHFAPGTVEIVNADSMQIYRGLDILTNKVPTREQKGVRHHLLGTVDANVEFSSRDFRDLAVPIIDDILARGCLPVIVGGTNYYIQALVSSYLIDEMIDEMDECTSYAKESIQAVKSEHISGEYSSNYDLLMELDPVAANRIHPNDHRKTAHYLALYESSGIIPSELLQGKACGKWGRPHNFRYDCCFLWIDVSLHILDKYVEQRVDDMMEHGLLNEVFDVFSPDADYTRGLKQAIGVREFEEFCASYLSTNEKGYSFDRCNSNSVSSGKGENVLKNDPWKSMELDTKHKILLNEAVHRLKANTRKLVRRQVRRLKRLQTFFGWSLHYVDATQAFEGNLDNYWTTKVVEPCASIVKVFICDNSSSMLEDSGSSGADPRELWTQFVCEACGNRVLRGAHEWEQHRQGRNHRKRVSHLRKKHNSIFAGTVCQTSAVVEM